MDSETAPAPKTIFRNARKDRDFTIIPNAILRNKDLSFKARGILAMLLSHTDTWQVHQTWLREQGTEGREAIAGGMQELEQSGYATYEDLRENGKLAGGRWTFFDEALPMERRTNKTNWKAPSYGKPEHGSPSYGKPSHGFPATKKTIGTEDQKTEDQENPLKAPGASPSASLNGSSIESKTKPTTDIAKRVAACVGRSPETGWGPKEVSAWKKLLKEYKITEENLVAVEVYYKANRKLPRNFCRRDLLTLINNFPGEVDRAKDWVDSQSGRNRNKSHEQKNDYYDQTF